jgi:DNA invertase Pin-like site-specific DNA recombinase
MDGRNKSLQLNALLKEYCDEIVQETCPSKSFDRRELDKCLLKLRKGDQLVVWRLDRVGKSFNHLVHTVNGLNKRGVDFVSLCEKLDTSTNGGKEIFSLFTSLLQFERNLISERTKEGLSASKLKGIRGGRPKKLDDDQILLARKMLSSGKAISEVAIHLKIGRNTLYRYLKT